MPTKKKAAAKQAAPKKAPPAAAKRYVERPVTYEAVDVEHGISEKVLQMLGAHRQTHVQDGSFVGIDIPGHGRARPGDVILIGDTGSIRVEKPDAFAKWYEEAQ